ncbi:MAG: S8 family serine peptidase [Paracoccaceae bacterium]
MNKKLKTFVLRIDDAVVASGLPQTELIATTTASPVSVTPRVKLEVLETEPGERAEIAGERSTLRVGFAMPITLIAPKYLAATTATGDNWGITSVGADTLDETAGAGVKVAVLDTGIAADHPAFDGVYPITENFTDEAPEDLHGHGTHCAGTIFGQDVSGQRIGIARGIRNPLIAKVLGKGGGDSTSLFEAIVWARKNGARIVSMSLGMDFPGFQKQLEAAGYNQLEATSIALQGYRDNVRLFDKISDLFSASAAIETPLLIAAAGNESNRDEYRIATAPPAVADEILAVGAIDRSDRVAGFSNTNPDCSAPGVDILSANVSGGLIGMSGTSMATPHVAGIAAIHASELAAGGPFTPSELKTATLGRLADLPDPRSEVGFGKPVV